MLSRSFFPSPLVSLFPSEQPALMITAHTNTNTIPRLIK
jgi:hypothetical protein